MRLAGSFLPLTPPCEESARKLDIPVHLWRNLLYNDSKQRHPPAPVRDDRAFREASMRLTRQTNYAIRILMYCAANNDRLSHVAEVADAYNVSELFLFKILKPLVEHGMVETVRGRNGGIRLARPAAEISLFDVVRVTEENFAMAECFENDAVDCPLVDSCGVNAALSKALGAFFEVLASHSIEDVVRARPNIASALGIGGHRAVARSA
jgi:Rrf2 family iron-responsive transcriptional regulator